jgi:hypothetical protein
LIVLLTLLVAWRASIERWRLLKGAFAVSALILALLLLVRIVWDATFIPLPLNLPWSDEWTYLFGVTVVPLFVFIFVPSRETFELIRKIGVWLGSLTIILVLAAAIYGLRNARNIGRLSTDFLNPISLAQTAVSCLIIINAQALAGVRWKRGTLLRFGRWLLTFICILTVIASLSKGPIIGLFSVGAVGMLFRGHLSGSGRSVVTRLFVLVLSLSIGLGLLWLLDTYTPIPVLSRFTNAATDPSTSTRFELFDGAISQFEESPLLGSSFVEYASKFYPHNIIIEAMMTNGVLGLAALVSLLFGCLYFVGRMLWFYPNDRWIALLFIQYIVESMFSGSLYFDASTWAVMLLVLSCAQAHAAAESREPNATLDASR